jgi:diketogulonate reductase-like aldo/keto reductase
MSSQRSIPRAPPLAPSSRSIRGVQVPRIFYGTAWKEARTTELTRLALATGFRAIDTANQRKHYDEAAVGAALGDAPSRADLFLQTKFTYARGQDHRLPYDAAAPLALQVQQSIASSLEHLGTDVIDSYVLHGPYTDRGWSDPDRQVWGAMEDAHRRGQVRLLGVSNLSVGHLEALCAEAKVAPAFVQNRCYARDGWDQGMRSACARLEILYQGFSLLTANRVELARPEVLAMAQRYQLTPAQLTFAFAIAVGMIPITGTSSAAHMSEDLRALELRLRDDDVAALLAISGDPRTP